MSFGVTGDDRGAMAAIARRMASWRARTMALKGWRRFLLAIFLGALLALALPPFHLIPLAVVSLVGLSWLIEGTRNGRGAFGIGWVFGFGHFLAGLYWIVNALLLFGTKFLVVYPIVVGFLPSILAIFIGLATMATRLTPLGGPARILALAGWWIAFEWLRGNIFTGFPWNLTGYIWAFSDQMLQFASILGIYGLSFLAVAALAMPATLGEGKARRRDATIAVGGAGLALLATFGFGALRLAGAPAVGSDVDPTVVLRIVQPNVEQVNKWDGARHAANFQHHLDLSASPGHDKVTAIIWPETAATFFLAEQKPALAMVAEVAPKSGVMLIGTPRRTVTGGERRLWNSMIAVDGRGEVVGTFDKFHLVPLGEYVPLKDYLPLTKVVQGASDYSAGPGPRTLRFGGLPPTSPLICYEVIFPGHVLASGERPAWMLNITNDGWYGDSPGPRQHFAIARLRAVEEGLPLVRSANTGISGVIDSYGRVVAKLDLGKTGVVDQALPKPLGAPPVFARLGNWTVLAILLATAIACAGLRAREKYGRDNP